MQPRRYAVYYAPPSGSALAAFGASWLGWDAEAGVPVAQPEAPADIARLTEAPRKYGFHGTLKAPFRLAGGVAGAGGTDRAGGADGADGPALSAALADLAGRQAPFEQPMRLGRMGRFLALVPDGDAPALAALAAACVRDLDRFRAPPTEAELARRRAAGLTPAEDANLVRWGYPYVFDRFRFHMTLSGSLPAADLGATERVLADALAPLTAAPVAVHDICLFGEGADGRFRVLERHALTG